MKKHYIIFLSALAGSILLDLLTKIFLYDTSSAFLPYIIGIRYASLNTGAAWSFLSGHIWLFCVLAFLFIIAVSYVDFRFRAKKKVVYSLGLGFLLGGTIGNLIDRLAIGGVRDFLFFEFSPGFPTFNFADVSLTIGCILIAVYLLLLYKPKDELKKKAAGQAQDYDMDEVGANGIDGGSGNAAGLKASDGKPADLKVVAQKSVRSMPKNDIDGIKERSENSAEKDSGKKSVKKSPKSESLK